MRGSVRSLYYSMKKKKKRETLLILLSFDSCESSANNLVSSPPIDSSDWLHFSLYWFFWLIAFLPFFILLIALLPLLMILWLFLSRLVLLYGCFSLPSLVWNGSFAWMVSLFGWLMVLAALHWLWYGLIWFIFGINL